MEKSEESGDKRKKAIIGVIVVVAIILLWQVKGMFGGGSSSNPVIKPAGTAQQLDQSSSSSGTVSVAHDTSSSLLPSSGTTASQSAIFQQATEAQKVYLQAINKLQLLKIQQKIAEAKRNILSAKLASIKSERTISDIVNVPDDGLSVPKKPTIVETSSPAPRVIGPSRGMPSFQLMSVSRVGNAWGAILSRGDDIYTVGVGSTLDGGRSTIKAINADRVIIKRSYGADIVLTLSQ